MSDTVVVALISGSVSLAGACIAIIPTIISNRKKTTKEIADRNGKIEDKLNGLENTLNNHIKEDIKKTALDARTTFLRFYDEEKHRHKHSRECWMDIIECIDIYDNYCNENPDYTNHKGDIAKNYLIKTFEALEETGDFLK